MRILIADDDPVSRRILAITLLKWGHELVIAETGVDAWTELQKRDAPRIAILDWMMPGMEGTEVCRLARANEATSHAYLILLTALARKEDLVAGLDAGADDYLTKPLHSHELRARLNAGARIVELQSNLALRVSELELAVEERKQAEAALRNLTLTDHLTGLYNDRGFLTLAEHHIKSVRRKCEKSLLLYADMDGLKEINDNFGHNEGSRAIASVADILSRTFRDTDIVARLGGDEFVVLAKNLSGTQFEMFAARLDENIQKFNETNVLKYPLSLSTGAVLINHDSPLSLQEFIDQADTEMYANKRAKRIMPGSESIFTPAGNSSLAF